ncbi:MAG: Ig-like domain-containing protein [Lachnospiraceae bacterium]|nr:Ig-like domain-containing protein [Lachnospiraceae bacterium]
MKIRKGIRYVSIFVMALLFCVLVPGKDGKAYASTFTIEAGSRKVLYAQAVNPTYRSYGGVSRTYIWTTDNNKILSLESNGNTCVVTGLSRGTTWVYCKVAMRYYSYDSRLGLLDRYEEKFGGMWKITVHKDPVYPTAISLRPSSITMNRKETRNLTYTIYPANADDRKARFASSNSKVAVVDSSGVVHAVGKGTATVTASTCNGIKKTVKVTVKIPKLRSLSLNYKSLTLQEGDKRQLRYSFNPAGASVKVTWSSSNPKVASVNKNGLVQVKKQGTAVITAKDSSGVKATCKITAKPKATKITLSRSSLTLPYGKTATLAATVYPKNAMGTVKWYSNNRSTAAVDMGKITAGKPGVATITAKISDKVKAVCKVTVSYPSTTSISLSGTSYIMAGVTKQFTATPVPADGNETVTWSSSNPSVATVNNKGQVTARRSGTATITVTKGKAKASQNIIVTEGAWVDLSRGHVIVLGNCVYQTTDAGMDRREMYDLRWTLGQNGVPADSLTLVQSTKTTKRCVRLRPSGDLKVNLAGINIEGASGYGTTIRSCFEAGGSRIYLNLMEGTVNKISGSSCAMYHSNCDELVIQGKGTLQLYGGSGPAIYGEFIRIAGGTILAQTGASNAAVIGVYSYYQHTVQNIRIMSGAYVTAKGGACALGSPSGKNKNVEYAPGTLTYSK